MAFNLIPLLTEDRQRALAERDSVYAQRRLEMKKLSDKNLVATAKYYMSQMRGADHWEPGEPVYDAAFYYTILPELLRRLSEKADEETKREIEKRHAAQSSHIK